VITIVKESFKFELARLKKKKKKKKKKEFGTFSMLYSATGCASRHEDT